MNSLQAMDTYHDWPNQFWPAAAYDLAILENGCYRARWEAVPGTGFQDLPAGGYQDWQLGVEPGSFVWAFTSFVITDLYAGPSLASVQVTDVGTGLKWFSQPIRITDLASFGPFGLFGNLAGAPTMPRMLPKKRLVGPPGKLTFQFWNSTLDVQRVALLVWFAEPKPTRQGGLR